MTAFKSFSQAGQDRFVVAVTGGIGIDSQGGTFFDVGCCHPHELSNTFVLESVYGWKGIMVDNDPGAVEQCRNKRISAVIEGDATAIDWEAAIEKHLPRVADCTRVVDYLSIDVDGATVAALANLFKNYLRFCVVTVEHDAYRFGDGPRKDIEDLMHGYGYELVCRDVCSAEGHPFEHWYVHPAHVAAEKYERFRCEGKRWTEILPL